MNNEITNIQKPVLVTSTVGLIGQSPESPAVTSVPGMSQKAVTTETQSKEKQPAKAVPLDTLKSAAETGNSLFQATNRSLQFQVDDSSKVVVVKVVDTESGKVIRQIPSEEMLSYIDRMKKLNGDKGSVLQDSA
jgi:flagellar protein FlaG